MQAVTPDKLRGRVLAADYVVGAGGGQLGNLESGALGSLTSPVISALTGGLLTIVAVVGDRPWPCPRSAGTARLAPVR